METLKAHREFYSQSNCILTLKNPQGKTIKQFTNILTQPSKRDKTVTIKGTDYLIDWSGTKNR